MKKIILLFLAFFIFQFTYAQTIAVGPKIGINSSKIILDDDVSGISDGSRKVGFHLGAFGRFEWGPVFAQPELLYTSARGEIEINRDGINQLQDYTFDKIDLPIIVGLRIGPLFRVYAGPVGNFLFDASGDEGALNRDVLRNYKNATFGYQLGVGVDIGNLIVDLKYEDNLSVFGDGINVGTQRFAVDQRNNMIILSMGFRLFNF